MKLEMDMPPFKTAILSISLLVASAGYAADEQGQQLVLFGATVLDGTSGPAIVDGVVVLDGDRISCVGAAGQCEISKNAEVIDVSGKWVTPGLIDSHVHFSQTGWLDGRPDGLDATEVYPYFDVARSVRDEPERFFRSYLCSGVTAVYDVGGHEWTLQLGARTEQNPNAPHIRAAGSLVTHAPQEILNTDGFTTFLPMGTEAEGRDSVAKLQKWGSSAVKVWYLKPPDGQVEALDRVFMAVADEARSRDLDLIVHATTLREAKLAVSAGAALLVHGVLDEPVDEEFLQAVAETDVIYTPTLVVSPNWWRALASVALGTSNVPSDPNNCVDRETARIIADTSTLEPFLPEYLTKEQAQRFLDHIPEYEQFLKSELLKVYEAGITIATGTDAGNPLTLHGVSMMDEMLLMQKAGIPASEILVMSTQNGARAMGRLEDLGTLESGKVADLLVLDADPAVDVANFHELVLVVRAGQVHTIDELSFGPVCSDTAHPIDVVQAQVDAYNDHDLERFLACYADDATIYDLAGERPVVRGHSAMRETYSFLESVPEEFRVDIIDRLVSDAIIVDTERFVGLPEGVELPDAVAVYEVRNGKIQNVWFPPIEAD